MLGGLGGRLGWAGPVVIGLAVAGCLALLAGRSSRVRAAALATALVGLVVAPTAWAAQTLGHATNGTFPAGGPATAGGPGTRRLCHAWPALGPQPSRREVSGRVRARHPLPRASAHRPAHREHREHQEPEPGALVNGSPFGRASSGLGAAIAYARAHGGGTIGVASQSSAAAAIISDDADVAGLGGFSGRESSVSTDWLAAQVRVGRLSWVIPQDASGPRLPGDSRPGSTSAFAAVARACRPIKLGSSGTSQAVTIYGCRGAATAIVKAGGR